MPAARGYDLAAQAEALPSQRHAVRLGGAKEGREERVGSVLRFERVLSVSHLGLAGRDENPVLNLLAVTFEKTDPPSGMVLLAFADGAIVRLEVECLEAELRDIGPRRPRTGMPGTRADERGDVLTDRGGVHWMAITLDMGAADFEPRFRALLDAKRESAAEVDAAVAAIIADVRARGDAALAEYSRRFDRVDLARSGLRIGAEEIDAALAACDPKALERWSSPTSASSPTTAARARATFLSSMRSASNSAGDGAPIDSVGLYVPGGAASYPSSVIMNAAPAKVAGCRRIAMVVPTPDGKLNPLVLAAAKIAGVTEIYRLGGAQAIAALAYGTASLEPVAKIVGPGNAYVAAAKRRVFGVVGIDMIAGPSEVVVLADSSADPRFVAADLLAQAEHDEAAQSILITDDAALARAVERGGRGPARRSAASEDRRRQLARFRRDHPGAEPRRGRAARRSARARAPRNHRARRRLAEPIDQQRRRDLHRPAYAGGDRRLCRRLQSRPADFAVGAFFLGARRARFSQAHFHPQVRREIARRARAVRRRPSGRPRACERHARSVAVRLSRDGMG